MHFILNNMLELETDIAITVFSADDCWDEIRFIQNNACVRNCRGEWWSTSMSAVSALVIINGEDAKNVLTTTKTQKSKAQTHLL